MKNENASNKIIYCCRYNTLAIKFRSIYVAKLPIQNAVFESFKIPCNIIFHILHLQQHL